jgi:hypothetical protein
VFESEKEPAAREEFREQGRGQVELINNAFRKKRKWPESPITQLDSAITEGFVPRLPQMLIETRIGAYETH